MKLTKHKLHQLINEALREGNEAQTIYKIIKGWWSAAEIVAQIQGTWTTDSDYRKSGYNSNPMGSDEFFKTRYVGKKFKLEFLEWTMENKWRRKKYGDITDAISIAVTDIIMSKFPELKRLSDWGMEAGSKETSRIYPNTRNLPNYRFKPEIHLLVNAVMGNNAAHQEQLVVLLQQNIDAVRQLKASGFDYEGKPPDDWRGYE
tara:strand:+ start:1971 stop:2579 length:609 start_codon:yes stop_codon:yes gene_type:complete